MSEKDLKKQLINDEEESGSASGTSGTGGSAIAFVDFISTGKQINDQDIPPEKLRHLQKTHDGETLRAIEEQKKRFDEIKENKKGNNLNSFGYREENPFLPHRILSQAAQFSGTVDERASPIPAQTNDNDTNQELRNEYELAYRPQLRYAPAHTPNPRATPRLTR